MHEKEFEVASIRDELQLYLRIAFPLYKNHSLTAVLLATFFLYIERPWEHHKLTSIYYFLYKSSISTFTVICKPTRIEPFKREADLGYR